MSPRRKRASVFEVPAVDSGLQEAIDEVSRFYIDLRGVGHFPSPSDSRWIVTWCEAGVPTSVLLRALHRAATELSAKGSYVRNISQLKRGVEGDLKRYRARSLRRPVASGPGGDAPGGDEPSQGHNAAGGGMAHEAKVQTYIDAQTGILASLEADGVADGHKGWIRVAATCREAVQASVGALSEVESLVPHLMKVSRRFYDGVWEILDESARLALREEAELSLEGWIRPMSEDSREQTILELIVADLRRRLGVLRPEDLFDLWED